MKSLIEEASSVFKALEKAWMRAGKPQSFSVKVYEEAQNGFLGFNSKPAKVGIFFEEIVANNNQERDASKRPQAPEHRTTPANGNHKQYNNRPQQRRPYKDRPYNKPLDTGTEQSETAQSQNQETRGNHSPSETQNRRSHETSRPRSDNRRSQPERKGNYQNRDRRPSKRDDYQQRVQQNNQVDKVEFPTQASAESTPPHNTPVQPLPVQSQTKTETTTQSTRRVLKVSGRQYSGPKKPE